MFPLWSISCSIFSAFCLKPCVMKNAVEPITAPNAMRGVLLSANQTTAESIMETTA